MTADSTIRDNALSCEARKIAYRQTKDGVVLSLLLHPSEIPDGLAIAPLGTRYMIALVEIGDDEQPKRKEGDVTAQQNKERPVATPSRPATDRSGGAQSWHQMSPTQQAGILCADKSFWKFIGAHSEQEAADFVRLRCGVTSRKDILPDNQAGRRWRDLVSDYRAWCREPEVV